MTKATPQQASILDGTTGWNMEVDLGKRLVFSDYLETRYCSVVQDREEAHHHRAYSTMGDKM